MVVEGKTSHPQVRVSICFLGNFCVFASLRVCVPLPWYHDHSLRIYYPFLHYLLLLLPIEQAPFDTYMPDCAVKRHYYEKHYEVEDYNWDYYKSFDLFTPRTIRVVVVVKGISLYTAFSSFNVVSDYNFRSHNVDLYDLVTWPGYGALVFSSICYSLYSSGHFLHHEWPLSDSQKVFYHVLEDRPSIQIDPTDLLDSGRTPPKYDAHLSQPSTPVITRPSTPIASRPSTPNMFTLAEQDDMRVACITEPVPAILDVPSWITNPHIIVGIHLQVIYTSICGSEHCIDQPMEVVVEHRGNSVHCLVNTSIRNEQLLSHWSNVHPAPIAQPHQSQNLLLHLML